MLISVSFCNRRIQYQVITATFCTPPFPGRCPRRIRLMALESIPFAAIFPGLFISLVSNDPLILAPPPRPATPSCV